MQAALYESEVQSGYIIITNEAIQKKSKLNLFYFILDEIYSFM